MYEASAMTAKAGSLLDHLYRLAAPAALRAASDQELLAVFSNSHHQSAFNELVARYGPMVLNVCRRVLGDNHDAEDAFQAAFMVLARKPNAVRPGKSLAAWLYGVAYRVALNARRAGKRRPQCQTLPSDAQIVSPRPDPLAELTARELLTLLEEEVQRLPEKCRLPVALCCLDGVSLKEAAKRLGLTEDAVKGRVERGRARLKVRLTARGFTVEAGMAVVDATRGCLWALPARGFVEQTVKAGLAFARGQQATTAGLSSAALRLAESALRGSMMVKLKAGLAVTFLAGFTVLGSGGLVSSNVVPQAEHPAQQVVPSGQSKTNGAKPRLDLGGDPLPEGAIARLGTSRLRHAGLRGITSLEFTPNGQQLVSQSYGDGIRIWDTATGRELNHRLFTNDSDRISPIQVTPDGKSVVALESTLEPTVRVMRWRNLSDLQVTREFKADKYFDTLCLSPDAKVVVVSGGHSQSTDLLDATTGKKLHAWKSHGWSHCELFTADSKTLISGGMQGPIQLWDVQTGALKQEIGGEKPMVKEMALSGDGKLLATVGMTEIKHDNGSSFPFDDFVRIWDVASGKELRQLQGATNLPPHAYKMIFSVAFAPDGKTLVTGGHENVVRFWDPLTGKVLRQLPLDFYGISTLAFSPDGKTLAIAAGQSIKLFDVASGKLALADSGHAQIQSFVLTPDGHTLASAGYEGDIYVWDAATGRARPSLKGHQGGVYNLFLAVDGRTLVSRSANKTISVWDLQEVRELRKLEATQFDAGKLLNFSLLNISGDAKTLVLAAYRSEGAEVVLVDSVTGKQLQHFGDQKGGSGGAVLSPDNQTLTTWDGERTCRVWNAATAELRKQYALGKAIEEFEPGGGPHYQAYRALASPTGRFIALWDSRRFLTVQELSTGKTVLSLDNISQGGAAAVAISFDDRMLAWGGDLFDSTIHVVEMATGQERVTLTGQSGGFKALAFSADGRILVSAGHDTTMIVWDLLGNVATKPLPLQPKELTECWLALRSNDAKQAFQALAKLTGAPTEIVAFLKKELLPVPAPNREKLAKWIADLDSPAYATRDTAMKELTNLAEMAEPALRVALDKSPPLETRRRLEQLLSKLEGLGSTGEPLYFSRAVEVLERIGTAEAKQTLTALASGAPGAWATREAKMALERLERR